MIVGDLVVIPGTGAGIGIMIGRGVAEIGAGASEKLIGK
jgi:hypothetical protein